MGGNKMKGESGRRDQKALALWAADCAEHVLLYFTKECPGDERPRKAIEAGRAWVHGDITFSEVRATALAAHAAARNAPDNSAARFAARAAGHAAATAHVTQHAFGAPYYALKAVSTNPASADIKIVKERDWQSKHLHKNLRPRWQDWRSRRLPKRLRPLMKKAAGL